MKRSVIAAIRVSLVGTLLLVACGGAQIPDHSFEARLDRVCESATQLQTCLDFCNRLAAFRTRCARSNDADDGCETIDERLRRARERYVRLAAVRTVVSERESSTSTPAPSPSTDVGTATSEPPTAQEVRDVVVAATEAAVADCHLAGISVLVSVALEIRTNGDVASAKIGDRLNYGDGAVPAVGTDAATKCLEGAYADLSFPPFSLPPAPRHGGTYQCPPGVAMFNPEKFCTRVVPEDVRAYDVAVMVDPSGSVSSPTLAQAQQFEKRIVGVAAAAACAATKASGFPAGVYRGEGFQRETGIDGSKVYAWKSLEMTVDDGGCIKWRGLAFNDIVMPSDEARTNVDKVIATCINEGDGSIAGSGRAFTLTATARGRGSGGTPIQSHTWKCPGIGKVQTDLGADLTPQGCFVVGADPDPTMERAAEAGCQLASSFPELSGQRLVLQKDGSVNTSLTLIRPSPVILRRVDRK